MSARASNTRDYLFTIYLPGETIARRKVDHHHHLVRADVVVDLRLTPKALEKLALSAVRARSRRVSLLGGGLTITVRSIANRREEEERRR